MGINRIVKKNLRRSSSLHWRTGADLRPRDEFGHLVGHCSEVQKKRREEAKLPYKGE